MIELRPYQKAGIRKIFEAWDPERGNFKNVLFQMPTGTGKTTVFSEIVRKAQHKEKKVLIIVHRIELVEQISERLTQFQVDVGIISSNIKTAPEHDVQVATIQSLSRREYPPADIVIIDECHHSKAETYRKLWGIYPEARFLGVTATPVRMNGEGFNDLYQTLIPLGKLSYFFQEGYLARIKHMVCSIPDLSKVKLKMRDYDIQMLRDVMLENSLMANLVDSYLKFANGKKSIVFAVDIEHSKEIVKRYINAGIAAAHLDANTSKRERKEILDKFKSGEFLVLSNVDIVSEGFDVPDCEVVQLARPTKSLVLYLQQVGRCMRPFPGKEFGLILDNAGLWLEHGLSYIDREWLLEGKSKKKKGSHVALEVIAVDEEGTLRNLNRPVEAEGLELIELTDELERLLIFESFLRFAKANDHKIVSAFFKYKDYLIDSQTNLTDIEIQYISKRMRKEGYTPKNGYWYHQRKDIEDKLKT